MAGSAVGLELKPVGSQRDVATRRQAGRNLGGGPDHARLEAVLRVATGGAKPHLVFGTLFALELADLERAAPQ